MCIFILFLILFVFLRNDYHRRVSYYRELWIKVSDERGRERAKHFAALREVQQERIKLLKGLHAVSSLMNESYGVTGLHLNGDVAPWSDLRSGGKYEGWLHEFDAAIADDNKTKL